VELLTVFNWPQYGPVVDFCEYGDEPSVS